MDEKETWWIYERMKADGKIETAWVGQNDYDGKRTGVPGVFGVTFWLDENPEQARALGWIRHIHHSIEKTVNYNKQTQYVEKEVRILDPYTVEDVYHVRDKTEAMMRAAEEGAASGWDYSENGMVAWEV